MLLFALLLHTDPLLLLRSGCGGRDEGDSDSEELEDPFAEELLRCRHWWQHPDAAAPTFLGIGGYAGPSLECLHSNALCESAGLDDLLRGAAYLSVGAQSDGSVRVGAGFTSSASAAASGSAAAASGNAAASGSAAAASGDMNVATSCSHCSHFELSARAKQVQVLAALKVSDRLSPLPRPSSHLDSRSCPCQNGDVLRIKTLRRGLLVSINDEPFHSIHSVGSGVDGGAPAPLPVLRLFLCFRIGTAVQIASKSWAERLVEQAAALSPLALSPPSLPSFRWRRSPSREATITEREPSPPYIRPFEEQHGKAETALAQPRSAALDAEPTTPATQPPAAAPAAEASATVVPPSDTEAPLDPKCWGLLAPKAADDLELQAVPPTPAADPAAALYEA